VNQSTEFIYRSMQRSNASNINNKKNERNICNLITRVADKQFDLDTEETYMLRCETYFGDSVASIYRWNL